MGRLLLGSQNWTFFGRAGERPWILERRNGLARGIKCRLFADDRCSGRQSLAATPWRLNSMISAMGVFGLPVSIWLESSGPL